MTESTPKSSVPTHKKTLFAQVGPDSIGRRLDAVLVDMFPGHSRSSLAKAVKSGLVLVDGAAVKPSSSVRPGQNISFTPPDVICISLSTPATPLKILYEDAFLLAVDKQPGLSVHPGSGTQGPTLAGALLASYPDLSGVGEQDRPGIVHRLDKDTSGALVIARTTEALESLKAAFAVRDVRKRYIAFVKGLPPKTGTIDAPIARHPVLRHRMSADLIDGKHAVTTWRVLRRFALSGVTLVSARLFTGRTHQARVHLASAGYPILGDSLYGSSNKSFFQSLPSLAPLVRRQLLHARRLSVPHPAGGRITFSAPWPEDFLAVYRELDQFETFYLR